MRFSEGRLSFLAHQIVAALKKDGLADVQNERLVLGEIKHALEQQHERDARIDELVRRKIASLSRRVPPGSPEWDILYRKYFAEEQNKQKA